ncbi:hypothetical protein DSL72_006687 [Monilinia vaccinii-corymbosi]|uniref:C2H2-type domain-containing protein n=1 Tax=Monilinia vaccinii-corymbosi TaxID=61207 RepID=A0A8A3PPG8_9HELO|nr:hypothetical protein DSL72_006687 [Monilinia vaccinii-corymbosi]
MIRPLVDPRGSRRRHVSTLALYARGSSRGVSIVQGTSEVVSTIRDIRVILVPLLIQLLHLLDTHEKPFPCRLCGRRYARKDVVIRHEKSFHRVENPRRQPPPPLQSPSPDADADSEPFADPIVVNSHNQSADSQVPIKLEQQETPEMQSTLDPLLREHDAQLAEHSGSSGPHMNGHGGPNHGFQQYQNGFIDPALDISDLFGPSPNIITRT